MFQKLKYVAFPSKRVNHHFDGVMIIVCFYAILPFLLLSLYNQPSIDDFEYAVRDNQNGFIATQIETYLNWSGRYFATAVSRINPIRFQSFLGYKVSSVLLLLTFILSLFLLLSALFIKLNKKQRFGITVFVTALYFAQMPDISRGLFYMTAYLVYQLPSILVLLLFTLLLLLPSLRGKSSILLCRLIILLICVAIIGSNELSLILLLSSLAFILYMFRKNENPELRFVSVVFVCSLVASLVMLLAPGNFIRMEGTQNGGRDFLWAAIDAFILVPSYFYKWGVLLTFASILYIYLWQNHLSRIVVSKFIFKVPLRLSLLVFISTLFLMNLAYIWSTGTDPKASVGNVIYFYFVLGWFYNLHVAASRFFVHFEQIRPSSLVSTVLILLFFRLLLDIDNNISTAYLDLVSGKAYRHNKELNERYEYLKASNCRNCIVQPLSGMPRSLYIYDLTCGKEENELLKNSAPRKYWGKDKISLASPGPSIENNNRETLYLVRQSIKSKLKEIVKI